MRNELIKWIVKLLTFLILLIIVKYVEIELIQEAVLLAAVLINGDVVASKLGGNK